MNFKYQIFNLFETGFTHFIGQNVCCENTPVSLNWESKAAKIHVMDFIGGWVIIPT